MSSTVTRILKSVSTAAAATALAIVLASCSDESEKSAKKETTSESTQAAGDDKQPESDASASSGSEETETTAAADAPAEPKAETAETEQPAAAPAKKASVPVPQADGSVDMAEVLKPGPMPDMSLGSPDAPVKIVEYMSMTCPHCASFHANTFKQIVTDYVDTGKAQFIVREFPFDPRAAAAIMLARCAPNGKFFPMVDVLFQQQSTWSRAEDGRAALLNIAKLAGFTQETFEACLTDQKLADDVNAVRNRGATEFGISSTPSFLINGKRYSGNMSVDQMSAIIDSNM